MAEVCTPWSPSYEDCVNNYHPIVIRVDDHVDCESSNVTYWNFNILNILILVIFGHVCCLFF